MVDVAVVGAGAAGLATGIFVRRLAPGTAVIVFDGARVPGAKILVSGGSRCNVTNRTVTEADFWGGPRTVVRRVLAAFTVADTIAFFEQLGVGLHEEADGKLFPNSNRSRDVRDALLAELRRVGAQLHAGERVAAIERVKEGFAIHTSRGETRAAAVVVATGGQSLAKTGSDGAGYVMVERLGHTLVPRTPGLVPLVLAEAPDAVHRELTGVAHPAQLRLWLDGRLALRLNGPLLWTHFGISGPVALNLSRHWLRAQLEGRHASVTVSLWPDREVEHVDTAWTGFARERPTATVQSTLSTLVPAAVAAALLRRLDIDQTLALAHLNRDARRRLARSLVDWPLYVVGSRGYNYAEVTAGGVALGEVDPRTMQSRRCPGLFLVGEILDVDGRLGGFNFQWAWSSAHVAARGILVGGSGVAGRDNF